MIYHRSVFHSLCLKGGCILKIYHRKFCEKFSKVNLRPWNIVFFGSDNFSIMSLKEILKESNKSVNRVEVVTVNFNTPLYKFSKENNIEVHIWPPELKGFFDLGVIVSFGKLIPKALIDFFPLGIINVHASLLPKWRGAMPIVHTIKNGDTLTGVTIQKIKPDAFDTGDIILKKICLLGKNELYPSVYAKLSKCGSECLMEVIKNLPHSLENSESQVDKGFSYARKINKKLAIVKWGDLTSIEVYNLYRALFGIYDLKTTWKGNEVKLICMSLTEMERSKESILPGSITYDKRSQFLLVNCKDKPLKVCTLMMKGKIYMAKQFYRGFLGGLDKKDWIFGD